MIQLLYRVHSVVPGTQMQMIEFEGHEVEAAIPNLEVELSWDGKDGRQHGSQTLRFVGQDMAAAREIFVQDGMVELSYSKVMTEAPVEPAVA